MNRTLSLVGLLCLVIAAQGALPQRDPGVPPVRWQQFNGEGAFDLSVVEFEAAMLADPLAQAAWLRQVSHELTVVEDPALVARLQTQLAAFMRLRSARLAEQSPAWTSGQAEAFLALLMIDPRRFLYDADFRVAVVPILRDGLAPEVPMDARRSMMGRLFNLEFGRAETIEMAWGLAERPSRTREVMFGSLPDRPGSLAPIRASVYSLPIAFFDFYTAARFLRGVHAYAPERDLMVLTSAPLIDQLRPLAQEMSLHLIDTLGRQYTPWPRDPFMIVSPPDGPVTVISRPNLQARREADVFMGRELVQGLPQALDDAWGGVEWTVAPVPFHGGHTLATPGVTWASIHTLLPRIVEILGANPTPDSLTNPARLEQFVTATNTARRDFEAIFGQPLRFVHPVPDRGPGPHPDFATMLVGGGTSDLDSLVTILPGEEGSLTALVADFGLGSELLRGVPAEEVDELARTYSTAVRGESLRQALLSGEPIPEDVEIGRFLDQTAEFLAAEGLVVERLPLIKVPEHVLAPELRVGHDGFLITWNNVVLQWNAGARQAEGFTSGLPSIDETARRTYERAGYDLHFAPVLARSVMRDGGYRCASNHVREPRLRVSGAGAGSG